MASFESAGEARGESERRTAQQSRHRDEPTIDGSRFSVSFALLSLSSAATRGTLLVARRRAQSDLERRHGDGERSVLIRERSSNKKGKNERERDLRSEKKSVLFFFFFFALSEKRKKKKRKHSSQRLFPSFRAFRRVASTSRKTLSSFSTGARYHTTPHPTRLLVDGDKTNRGSREKLKPCEAAPRRRQMPPAPLLSLAALSLRRPTP